MANLPESSSWNAGVYQIETTDDVIGGVNGVANAQAKALANRTLYLKNWLETGSTLLNRILAIDGYGSGIDADKVRGLPADFSALLAATGYQKFPSGLVMQWGSADTLGATYKTVTFPVTFPTACVLAVPVDAENVSANVRVGAYSSITAAHVLFTFSGTASTFSWIAIGY